MQILLVRHGRMAGDPYCEPESPVVGCLSPEGIAQAERLRERLLPIRIDKAFTSPYGRAVETAERGLAGRGIPLERLPGIQEWTPSTEYRNATSTEAEALMVRDRERYAEETWKTELGEGTFDVYARCVPAILGALAKEGWHARMGGFVPDPGTEDKTLAFFAHGGSLGVILSFLLGTRPFPLAPYGFGYCGVATISYYPRHGVYFPNIAFE